ncbi:MAG: AAA family ATPase, partial [Halobacteriota archaeon]
MSSTFSDLIEERNALQREVFPRLRALCQEHGCRFQAIDLRWGVREEAALDQRTVPICIEEIERCQHTQLKPNFIVLLGDRYGWQPAPYEIQAALFDPIIQRVNAEDEELLQQWYKRDDNAVPAVFCLQPRTGDYEDPATWEPVERRLRSVLEAATSEMQISDAEHLDFFGSATEQEIYYGALNVPHADEHVFCFFRTIEGLPHDTRAHGFIDLTDDGQLDRAASERLNHLKEELHAYLPGNTFTYSAQWQKGTTAETSPITTDHLAQLCEDVYSSLSATIINETDTFEHVDEIDQEQADHWAFADEHIAHFEGRKDILRQIAEYLGGDEQRPLVVRGVSGVGKSSLLARAARDACDRFGPAHGPCESVVCRFIGATPGSSDGRSLLESLLRQVSRMYGEDEGAAPTDYEGLVKAIPERLALATPESPLIIVLDALDQLSRTDNAHLLAWLPAEVPPHVRLVVSILPGEALDALARRGTPPLITDLPAMPPEEGRAVLERWLSEAHRTLQGQQREEVLTKFDGNGLPLYLRLAFEEAQRWRSYTPCEPLSPDLHGIITDLFERLESPTQHGQLFVAHCLGYLSAARRGLTEDELLDVLSRDEEVFDDFTARAFHTPPERRLPVVVWSRLFFDLEPYLTERRADQTSLIGFYHRALAEGAAARYLAGHEHHAALARYFGDRRSHPLFKDAQRRMLDHRVASELPYQQRKGTLWEELQQTLTDLHFVEAKCAAGMTYDLITDYVRAREVLPGAREEVQREREREDAGRRYGAELIAYAKAHSERRRREQAREPRTTADEPTSGAFGIATRLRDRFARRPRNAHRDQQELSAPLPRSPLPRSPVPPSLPIPPSPIASDRQDEHGSVEADLVSSPHIRIRMFHQFLDSHSHLFTKFAALDSFCIQYAYNYADAGPVAEQAQHIITTERSTDPLLLR